MFQLFTFFSYSMSWNKSPPAQYSNMIQRWFLVSYQLKNFRTCLFFKLWKIRTYIWIWIFKLGFIPHWEPFFFLFSLQTSQPHNRWSSSFFPIYIYIYISNNNYRPALKVPYRRLNTCHGPLPHKYESCSFLYITT